MPPLVATCIIGLPGVVQRPRKRRNLGLAKSLSSTYVIVSTLTAPWNMKKEQLPAYVASGKHPTALRTLRTHFGDLPLRDGCQPLSHQPWLVQWPSSKSWLAAAWLSGQICHWLSAAGPRP